MTSNQQTLNAKQKKELCQAREDDPKLKYKDLVTIAEKKFGISPSDSQITRMIKRKAEYLSLKDESKGVKRIRSAKWPALEEATDIWFEQVCFRYHRALGITTEACFLHQTWTKTTMSRTWYLFLCLHEREEKSTQSLGA